MAICANGHPNPDDSRFCLACGLQLATVADAAQGAGALGAPGVGTTAMPPPSWTSAPTASPRSRPAWLIPVIVAGGLVVLVLVGLVIRAASGGGTTTVRVEMTIIGEDNCSIGLGYLDVPGSAVTIQADGELVGMSTLSEYGDSGYLGCTFATTVSDVPTGAATYTLTIGRRGDIKNTRSELEGNDWTFEASLG